MVEDTRFPLQCFTLQFSPGAMRLQISPQAQWYGRGLSPESKPAKITMSTKATIRSFIGIESRASAGGPQWNERWDVMERKFQAEQNGRADYAKCLVSNGLPHPSTRRSFCAPEGYHAGRIAKTVRSRFRKLAKKSSNCFHGTYFWFSSPIPCSASSPVTISARASAHSPFNPPRMSHGAIRTRGLFRMRFTFPETPIVYTKSFASLESSRTDGSAANHTGVFTPSPLFLNVSRFKYLCPANVSNPIALPPEIPCRAFYAGHKKVGQTF